MIKVLVIAPYPGLVELITHLDEQLTEFEITIEQGDLSLSLGLLDKYKNDHFDLIISRGGTANLIRKHTSTPVLNMQISGYDILRILTLLKGYQTTTIGMIGFKDVIKSFESVSNLMDIEISYIEVQHENQVAINLEQAKKKGIRVIVGDTITVRLANEIGLQGVLITSGRESVLKTFEDAKQLYLELHKTRTDIAIYETVINQLDEGVVILNSAGEIKFTNEMFRKIIGHSSAEDSSHSLFEELPFIKSMLQLNFNESAVIFQLAINNFDEIYEIKHQEVNGEYGEILHYIHFRQSTFTDDVAGIQLIFSYKTRADSPQYITSGTLFEESINKARDRLDNNLPVSIIGEEGTGKRIFVQALTEQNKNTIEIKINVISTRVFNQLMKLIEQIDPNTIMHIRDIEKASHSQQLRIMEELQQRSNKVVFSFISEEASFSRNDLKLSKALHNLLLDDFIFFPALRERESDLEGFIQTFIIQFNEQFGRQIVGIKPNVLQRFLSHPWFGNLIELRNVLKKVIQKADSEFIDEDALPLLRQHYTSNNIHNHAYINLEQSLDKIERDVIKIILEEEDMNQSKVAKRLGINRSTLWRRIKSMEDAE